MKMALQGNTLIIADADNVQFGTIKSWGKMRWDKKTQRLIGTADIWPASSGSHPLRRSGGNPSMLCRMR
jgi:hypothetical protein